MEKRADALDALRGFAIITMILSGSIPFSGPAALPGWMYHAQVPPPDHVFNPNLPGITWVDLVFPFFLFAMGAAFPFALRKRLAAATPGWKLALQTLQRGFLLVLFALLLQHSKPYALSAAPDAIHWILGLLGFAALFLIFCRYPPRWNARLLFAIKALTALAAVALFSQLTYAKGAGFSIGRSDIIIIVLANVALFGSILWLLTRERPLLRLAVLGFLLAFRITHGVEGSWTAWVWNATPLPEIYKFYFLQYLFIVLPGTIAGDLYWQWMQAPETPPVAAKQAVPAAAATIAIAIILCNLYGLYTRHLLFNLMATLLLCGGLLLTLRNAHTPFMKLLQKLGGWGILWLLLGLTFEAFEGGIKKDPSTLSYYLVTTGLAHLILIAFSILSHSARGRKSLHLLISNGQNPMIAYISASHLVQPLLALTFLILFLNRMALNPWLGFLKGVMVTLLAALATSLFTHRKIFWRS